jgi:hypothetical protein
MSRSRYPEFEKGPDGVALCRGCRKPAPPRRQTWCSNECYEMRCPACVRYHTHQRDKGICSACGVNTERMARRYDRALKYPGVSHWDYTVKYVFDRVRYDVACAIRKRHQAQISIACKNRVAAMNAAGWPRHICRDWWEMDHIIPHSEGGPMLLENMRTLCYPCHKRRTKKWHRDRKEVGQTKLFV